MTSFFKENNSMQTHLIWFMRSHETLIGKMGNEHEIFMSTLCADIKASSIIEKVDVVRVYPQHNWRQIGGKLLGNEAELYHKKHGTFYYKLTFDSVHTRYTDPHIDAEPAELIKSYHCPNCTYNAEKELATCPIISDADDNCYDEVTKSYKYFMLNGKKIVQNSFVFIPAKTCHFKFAPKDNLMYRLESSLQKKCELQINYPDKAYTELHRKNFNSVRNLNHQTVDPWQAGMVERIYIDSKTKACFVTLQMFCRPDDLKIDVLEAMREDLNKLYLTSQKISLPAENIIKSLEIVYSNKSIPLYKTTDDDKLIFYFDSFYNGTDVMPVDSDNAIMKHVTKSTGPTAERLDLDSPSDTNLKICDLFASCGGLSSGLEQSGVGKTGWAVEFEQPAADAFVVNHSSDCSVFCSNSNDVLQQILNGEATYQGKKLPTIGEVDLLCGGPPCQGFSGMNRFNYGEYSRFKNSLIANYLSFVEKLRPRFAVMENVRNFASFKRSAILKLTLQAFIQMGYQVFIFKELLNLDTYSIAKKFKHSRKIQAYYLLS